MSEERIVNESAMPPKPPPHTPAGKANWQKRSDAQRLHDRAIIADLYRRGWSHQEICNELNKRNDYELQRSAITKEIKKIEEIWRDEMVRNLDIAKARELVKINKLEAEAWDRFEASKKPRSKRITVGIPGDGGGQKLKETHLMTEETDGDPRWFQTIQWCVEQRCKLLGLYAPQRSEVSGTPGGAPIVVADIGIDPAHALLVLEEEFRQKQIGPGEPAQKPETQNHEQ